MKIYSENNIGEIMERPMIKKLKLFIFLLIFKKNISINLTLEEIENLLKN